MDKLVAEQVNKVKASFISGGVGITGLTDVKLRIQRDIDSQWWTGSAWSGTSTELNAIGALDANLPGVYYYNFTPGYNENFTIRWSSVTAGLDFCDFAYTDNNNTMMTYKYMYNKQAIVEDTGVFYLETYDDNGTSVIGRQLLKTYENTDIDPTDSKSPSIRGVNDLPI